MSDTAQYDASSIQVLEGLEPVRRRPGMYIGDPQDGSGLRHTLYEVLANCVDQHLLGRATRVQVDVNRERVRVEDDGVGIPVGQHARGVSALEVIFTSLHAGATWDGHMPHVHLDLHGVGVSAVNAVSRRLLVHTTRGDRRWRMTFEKGRKVEELVDLGPTTLRGTCVEYWPDSEIFPALASQLSGLRKLRLRMQEIAGLNAGLRLRYQRHSFHYPAGLADLVVAQARGRPLHGRPVAVRRELDGVVVDAALFWTEKKAARYRFWVGQNPAQEGEHVRGLRQALLQGWRFCVPRPGLGGPRARDLRRVMEPGLTALLHVALPSPTFRGPTRDDLASPEARRAVRKVVGPALVGALRDEQPDLHDRLLLRLPTGV